ncbi:MAG: hypothetical protein IPL79_19630 [Myxococcales bacterium]|nr:hypothetical protein [Myxococcales bacterium]
MWARRGTRSWWAQARSRSSCAATRSIRCCGRPPRSRSRARPCGGFAPSRLAWVAIDWQGGRERHRFAIDLEISFVVVDAAALATWLLDQQEPDDIVEVLVARAVSRRVSWLLAELGPVRSELQRVIVSEIRTNVIRPICPGVALRQVIISQCERQAPRATTAAGAGEAGRAGDTPPVTAATAAHRVEDLTNTEEIDVSSIMVGALAGDTNSEIVLFSSDVLPAVDNERAASEITAPSLAAARAAMATEDDSEPYADIEVAAPAAGVPSQEAHGSEPVEHPAYPFGARVRVADHRGRWQAAVVTRSAPHMLEVQMEHSGRVLSVTPTDVKPS